MHFTIEHEREDDGRWLAEVPELPGALAYGATAQEAMAKTEALAVRVQAELAFQVMVKRGIADSDAKRTISNDKMARRIRSWRK